MKKLIVASTLSMFSSVGCASSTPKKVEEPKAEAKTVAKASQEAQEAPGDLIIKSGAGEEIIRVTYEGDLYHRKKKIDDKDAIISAFYDVVVSRTNGYANCLNTLMQNMEDKKKACAKNTK